MDEVTFPSGDPNPGQCQIYMTDENGVGHRCTKEGAQEVEYPVGNGEMVTAWECDGEHAFAPLA
jgi:hypothetical protein